MAPAMAVTAVTVVLLAALAGCLATDKSYAELDSIHGGVEGWGEGGLAFHYQLTERALGALEIGCPVMRGERLQALFAEWEAHHSKAYHCEKERAERLEAFTDNLDFVRQHRASSPGSSYSVGLNGLADMRHEEFRSTMLGTHPEARGSLPARLTQAVSSFKPAQITTQGNFSWVEEGAVTPVKNQKACGSCWAFSTTGSVEGANAVLTGKLVSLSEQELVDCDTLRDHGCMGGLMDFAFQFVEANGLDTEKDYPYTAHQASTCDVRRKNRAVVSIDGHEDIPPGDEQAILARLGKQPVSVAIEADKRAFQLYMGGVFADDDCGEQLDHGVLLVGYGTHGGEDYVLMKNSWGGMWGESGYMKMKLGVAPSGLCGLAKMASYPVKKHADPPAPPPTPPGPGPEPEIVCNQLSSCAANNTCCCIADIFSTCLAYGCCPHEEGMCCKEGKTCCPKGTECDMAAEACVDVETGEASPQTPTDDAHWHKPTSFDWLMNAKPEADARPPAA